MKVYRAILVLVFIPILVLSGFQPTQAQSLPQVSAEAAILIEANTDKVIFTKNPDKIMHPASTTKIMTALLALEYGDLEETVRIGSEADMIAWDSSRAHLQPGDEINLQDLLYGMMLPSGNDAAYSIAVHIARKIKANPEMPAAAALTEFANLMNKKARALGAENTNFVNPDGYPHSGHYTTARDLALITMEAINQPGYRELDSAAHHSPETWSGSAGRTWNNGNFLINERSPFFYEKAIGGKTGYTVPAGFCMVATAAEGDMELVAVVLKTNADGRWLDSKSMLDFGFKNYTSESLHSDGEHAATVNVTFASEPRLISLTTQGDYTVTISNTDKDRIQKTVLLNQALLDPQSDMPTLIAPLSKGQAVGKIVFSLDEKELHRTPLLVSEAVQEKTWWQRLFSWVYI